MRTELDRAVFTVMRHEAGWAVEYGEERFGYSPDKEVSKAFAYKRARQMQDEGRPCQIKVIGEFGFSGVR
jgi:hypothetical protein